jgi:hypothetical protein
MNTSLPLQEASGAWVADLEPGTLVAGQYRLELRDEHGFGTSRPWAFVVARRSDQPPQVQVELKDVTGVVTPSAQIPLHGTARDDFGLVRLRAHVQGETTGGSDGTQIDFPLADERFEPLQSAATRPVHIRELSFDETLDLASLKMTAGGSLQMYVEARDNDDILGPNIGRSSEITLRIVSESEFLADLLRREKVARQELAVLVKEQFELLTRSRAMAASLSASEALSGDQSSAAASDQRSQLLVGERVHAIADRLTHMAREIVNNRVEEPGGRMSARLSTQLAAPLQAMVQDHIEAAASLLGKARLTRDAATQHEALQEASRQQAAAAQQMQALLEQMVQMEGFQEAVQLLSEIQRAQTEVHEQTRRALEERIRRILEGAAKPQP